MRYVDFEAVSKNFARFWNHEYLGRCAVQISAPKKRVEFPPPRSYEDLVKTWVDGETVLERNRKYLENTYFLAEAFPVILPYLGAAGHAGFFNTIKHQFADTVWFFPLDPGEKLVFSKQSYFYKATIDLVRYLASENKDEYIISMPDTSGNIDALAHLRGSEQVLMDMLDAPGAVKDELRLIQSVWEEIMTDVYSIVRESNHGGSAIGWMGTYAPGLHAQMQSDMSVMLSPDYFDEFVADELKKQSEFLEYPVYHLDGIEQQRHLDTLLSIEKLRMIQYTFVAGQPSPVEQLPVLKKIQKSGKLLLLIIGADDVKPMLENLSAKGLFISTGAGDPAEADNLFKLVCDYSKE